MPPDGLLLLRGGDRILREDEVLDLIDAAAAAGRRYTLDGRPFYSLSTFGVAPGTTEKDVLAALPLRRFPAVYRVRAGAVYAPGAEGVGHVPHPRQPLRRATGRTQPRAGRAAS